MTLEYLLVNYKDDTPVLANDTAVGVTNHILMLPPGDYEIRLDGVTTTPATLGVELDGTSPVRPQVLLFS